MKVRAVKGVCVPMENTPHQYITEEQAVEVEATTYYLRRIADGDLLVDKAQAVRKVDKDLNSEAK